MLYLIIYIAPLAPLFLFYDGKNQSRLEPKIRRR